MSQYMCQLRKRKSPELFFLLFKICTHGLTCGQLILHLITLRTTTMYKSQRINRLRDYF